MRWARAPVALGLLVVVNAPVTAQVAGAGASARRDSVSRADSARRAATLAPVRVTTRALGFGTALQAAVVVADEQLAERMSASVAALVAAEPGVRARSNGPMATQPVIRGLSGDRVLVLEDGMRPGDISTTAPDHATTIEPATARRVEVIRGPAGLLYGSNTLGGVVNVIREEIATTRPAAVTWRVASHGESVNRGGGVSGRIAAPVGPVVVAADGAARTASETRVPGGRLPFTDLDGFDAGAAASWVRPAGHVGIAAREYRSFYGVPASFGGVTLPGAHAGGVYIDVHRTSGRLDAEWRPGGGIEAVSVGANGVRFVQEELEQGGFVGTRFGQLAAGGELVVRLRRGRHTAAVGGFAQWRDLRAEGSFTGTRPAVQRTAAAFAVDEIAVGRVTLLAGARYDRVTTRPLDTTETLLLRAVRPREFGAATGAVGARVELAGGWSVAVQGARAFRPPSIEELYSAGPHLANYAYEIGVPTLRSETGTGGDVVLRWQGGRGTFELATYATRVHDFIAFAPALDSATGLPLRDPRLRRYVVYRPQQGNAWLDGFEVRGRWFPGAAWSVEASADLARGTAAGGDPLPAMPPPSARFAVRRASDRWQVGATLDALAPLRRLPARPAGDVTCAVQPDADGEASVLPAEYCPAPGAAVVGLVLRRTVGGLRWPTRVTATVDNLFDTTWRDPLWRARLVAPQPGRNLRVMVEVTP